jgi:hypothetical protein
MALRLDYQMLRELLDEVQVTEFPGRLKKKKESYQDIALPPSESPLRSQGLR